MHGEGISKEGGAEGQGSKGEARYSWLVQDRLRKILLSVMGVGK